MKLIFIMMLGPMAAGFLLDLMVGDPHWLYHPVRLIGNLIMIAEKVLRKVFHKTKKGELAAGFCLVPIIMLTTVLCVGLIMFGASKLPLWAEFLILTLLYYWLYATRSLKDESMKVYYQLRRKDLPGARYAVSMIVGRDTENLTAEGVTKAAVETVAENTSDGIIAPMLYMAIGGPLLGWLYKSVNTMDSMVGYKNDKYLHFGRYAAKLDDVVNFIPARFSAVMMVLACPFVGLDAKQAWKIFKRDRFNHASPNSAQTESVMAGALHVQLAGDAVYFGKVYKKKTIGDRMRPIEAEDIKRANRLLYAASFLTMILMLGLRALITMLYML